MLTSYLEQLIIKGKAQLRTHMHLATALSKIEVPQGCCIVIIGFTAYPFSDVTQEAFDFGVYDTFSIRGTHIIEFINQRIKRNGYIVKNNLYLYNDSLGKNEVVNSEPVKYDCYHLVDSDVYLQVTTQTGIQANKGLNYAPLTNSQNAPPPAGYGNTNKVVDWVEFQNDAYYQPNGSDSAKPVVSNVTEQPFPRTTNNDATLLVDTANPNNQTVPYITVDYVLCEFALSAFLL
jgi:hypothetical protein